jgi:hypothetical protein
MVHVDPIRDRGRKREQAGAFRGAVKRAKVASVGV